MGTEDISLGDNSAQGEKLGVEPKPKRSRKRRIIIFTVVSLINVGLLALLWSQLLTLHSPMRPSLVALQAIRWWVKRLPISRSRR